MLKKVLDLLEKLVQKIFSWKRLIRIKVEKEWHMYNLSVILDLHRTNESYLYLIL